MGNIICEKYLTKQLSGTRQRTRFEKVMEAPTDFHNVYKLEVLQHPREFMISDVEFMCMHLGGMQYSELVRIFMKYCSEV